MTGMFDAFPEAGFLEPVALPLRQARLRRDPENAVRCFGERFDRRARQPFALAEAGEDRAIVAKQAVLRADPQVTRTILKQALGGEIAQPLFLAVVFEAVALRESRRDQAGK